MKRQSMKFCALFFIIKEVSLHAASLFVSFLRRDFAYLPCDYEYEFVLRRCNMDKLKQAYNEIYDMLDAVSYHTGMYIGRKNLSDLV